MIKYIQTFSRYSERRRSERNFVANAILSTKARFFGSRTSAYASSSAVRKEKRDLRAGSGRSGTEADTTSLQSREPSVLKPETATETMFRLLAISSSPLTDNRVQCRAWLEIDNSTIGQGQGLLGRIRILSFPIWICN